MWVNVPCPVHRLAVKALAKTLVLNLQNIVANGTMFCTNDIMETDDFSADHSAFSRLDGTHP